MGLQPHSSGRCRVQGLRSPSAMSTKLPWNEQKAFSHPGGLKCSALIFPSVRSRFRYDFRNGDAVPIYRRMRISPEVAYGLKVNAADGRKFLNRKFDDGPDLVRIHSWNEGRNQDHAECRAWRSAQWQAAFLETTPALEAFGKSSLPCRRTEERLTQDPHLSGPPGKKCLLPDAGRSC